MPREANLYDPNPSWLGKKVVRKPEYMDMVWQTLSQAFPYYNVSENVSSTQIKLTEFGSGIFEKSHFNEYQP